MKYLKCTQFAILVFAFPVFADVAISEFSQFETIKVSITGHTGQDPVYRSINGKPDFKDPKLSSPFSSKTLKYEFSSSLFDILIEPVAWTNEYLAINGLNTFDNQMRFVLHHGNIFDDSTFQLHSQQSGGSIPAPSTLLLILAGITARSRRRM